MTVPSKEFGPWTFSLNHEAYDEATPNDAGKKFLYTLKTTFTSFAQWSVVASSNGTTVSNIGDGGDVDHWDDSDDIVGGQSWVILENNVTGEQFLIDSDAASIYVCQYRYSATGAFNADGTTGTPPTSSEEVVMLDGSFGDSTRDSFIINGMISADGKTTRIFYLCRDGLTQGGAIILLEEMRDPPAEWTSTHKRCVNIVAVPRFQDYAYGMGPIFSDYDTDNLWNVYWEDVSATADGHTFVSPFYSEVDIKDATPLPGHNVYSPSKRTGYVAMPISLYLDVGPNNGGMGRLGDIYWSPYGAPYASTFDSSGSREWINWGCFLLPWDGTTKPKMAP